MGRRRVRLVFGVWTVFLLVISILALQFNIHSTRAPDTFSVSASTNVGGPITSNTAWTEANSPYIVTSSVLVSQGVTLTIEAGVVVKFNPVRGLQVDGQLAARGTEAKPIIFTSIKDDSYAGDSNGDGDLTTPAPGDWAYIFFTDTSVDAVFDADGSYVSGSILEYCEIKYGGSSGTEGEIHIDLSAPFLNHTLVSYSADNGIRVDQGTIKIANCSVSNNGGSAGILVENYPGGDVTIVGNTVANNSGNGVDVAVGGYMGTAIISNNNITQNRGTGIVADGSASTITGNVISLNSLGIRVGASNVVITNNIIMHNGPSYYWGGAGIHVDGYGGYQTITNNVIVNNTAGNSAALELWSYSSYSTLTVSHNSIIENKAISDSVILIYSGTDSNDTFKYNLLTRNRDSSTVPKSLKVSGLPIVIYNSFFNNSNNYEIYNWNAAGSSHINAKNNWWGTSNDAEVQAKIYDWFDDATKGIVDYSPYSAAIRTDVPISPPTGLTVTPAAANFTLNWNSNPEPDLAGYKIYYGTDSGHPYRYSINVGNVTTYALTGLSSDINFFTVTAYDVLADGSNDLFEGHESWYAQEAFGDKVPPTGSIVINDGATYTTSTSVTLTLPATDARSGVTSMRFSNDNTTWTQWEAYTTSKPWSLSYYGYYGDGTKTVYVQFKDKVGLVSQAFSDNIILDTTPPWGSIIIAAGTTFVGASYTNKTSVTLTLSASDATSGVAAMRFSNDNVTWSDWEPYSTSKSWTLSAEDGMKVVAFRYRDNAGLFSSSYDSIILDTIKPTADAGVNQTVNEGTTVIFNPSASHDQNGIASYTWTFPPNMMLPPPTILVSYTFATPGTYTITLKVTDPAGNWALDTVVITVLDITKPVANAGKDQTVNVGTTVNFDAGASTDNVGIVSYEWDFGDGTTGTEKITIHTYTNAGTYTVTLTVKDAANNSATHSITVTVRSTETPPETPPEQPAQAFPMWPIGAGAAIAAIAIAVATALLLRKRK